LINWPRKAVRRTAFFQNAFVPAIHAPYLLKPLQDMDARHKAGHDGEPTE
jgi:hypothetical protein